MKASTIFNGYSPESGVYDISNVCEDSTPFTLDALPAMQARCDMKTDKGGWIVLLRRTPDISPRVDFARNWVDYENGFGHLSTEFWYGLKNMHCLTKREPMQVRVDLKRTDGTGKVLIYNRFKIDGPDTQYTLHVGEPQQSGFDYFGYHDGMKFSTRDKDNDLSNTDCTNYNSDNAAWWFKSCYRIYLTAPPTIGGRTFTTSHDPVYTYAEMKVRPLSCTTAADDTCE